MAVPVLQSDQPVQLDELLQRQFHQERHRAHVRGQIGKLHLHGLQKALGIRHVALLQGLFQSAPGVPLSLSQPRDAGFTVDRSFVISVPAGVGAVERIIVIAVAGVHHDVDVERLPEEMFLRQLEPDQLLDDVMDPVVVLAGNAVRVWAGEQLGFDFILQLAFQLTLVVHVPLVQLLPEGLHGVL